MRIVAAVVLGLVGSAAPGQAREVGQAPGLSIEVATESRADTDAMRALFPSDASGAVITEPVADELLALGSDIDGGGTPDLLLAQARARVGGPGVGDDVLTVRAVRGEDGATAWGPVTLPRGMRIDIANTETPIGAPAVVATGWFFDADAIADVLIAATDLDGDSVVEARAGATGALLWRIARNGPGIEAGVGALLPRSTASHDRRRVLLGRSIANGTALETSLVAADGTIVSERTAIGIGMRPGATLADLDDDETPDVVLANPVRTPLEVLALVHVYGSRSPLAAPGTVPVRAPAQDGDHAISLAPLRGEQWQAGGIVVTFDRSDPAANGWARLTGPSRIVLLGRGMIERARITLPSASVLGWPGDHDGDGFNDVRTARIDHDSIVTETWSGHGTDPLLETARTLLLEADDYTRITDLRTDLGDVDGDARGEWLVGGGYPCGPRYDVIGVGGRRWTRPELRSLVCFGRVTPAGMSLDADAHADVLDWTTEWSCCLFGALPVGVRIDARGGNDGALRWSLELPELIRTDQLESAALGDRIAVLAGTTSKRTLSALRAMSGTTLWDLDVT